ncbi:MAG: transketolase [Zetaproteobacteria bacterium]|nr:MAG: transketolase [Zetaproteobacteria bacterium]
MTNAASAPSPQSLTHNNMKNMSNAIRALAMDAVQRANSGHPGMPMGMADVATILYSQFLKFDVKNPEWPDRDRFVLSGGHGSMLLYAVNYLTGYEKITLEEIKNFRTLGAITAGHPEVEHDAGIETTTGPLGQGLANAVGMALSERILNARYGDDLISHYTYTMCGDGDLMEGISHEACSLAGHLKLERLIVLYDDNGICIDGKTDLTFIDNTKARFEAYNWDVQEIDGHNFEEIEAAIAQAKTTNTPSLICCKTKIGFGAPTKENSNAAHGAPLGEDEIKGTRKNIGWPHDAFVIPDDVLSLWRDIGAQNQQEYSTWEQRFDASADKDALTSLFSGDLTSLITPIIKELKESFAKEKPKKATRQTSGMVLEKIIAATGSLVGGSADLTGSNNTKVAASTVIDSTNYGGNYINYGVREHAMGAIMNGISLHSNLVPYAGTFLQFADYSRPAIRLAALMKKRVIHVLTHDSIGLGEDGPTHQPVEHLSALRAIPNCYVYRPCDGIETAECWELAINNQNAPALLALTRQGLPTLCENKAENQSSKGAYILKETGNDLEITLFASGSEVEIANTAYEHFVNAGRGVRLVSCPCLDLFWEQDGDYIQSLICNKSIKVAVEAGIRQSWDRLIGGHSIFIGMDGFGASAPAPDLYKHFGITSDAIIERVEAALERKN